VTSLTVPRNLPLLVRASSLIGFQDLRAFYTWRSWTFGWLTRVVTQVLFFATIGVYLNDDDRVRFLVVGGAAAIAVMEAMTIVMLSAFDRGLGMLPLLWPRPATTSSWAWRATSTV